MISAMISEFTIASIVVVALISVFIFQTCFCELLIFNNHHQQEYLNKNQQILEFDLKTTFHLSGFENTVIAKMEENVFLTQNPVTAALA